MSQLRAMSLGLGLLVLPSEALAGAWTLPEGQGQAIVTTTASSANQQFDGSGGLAPIPRYNKLEVTGLFEYGITDSFTAIGSPSFQHIDMGAPLATRSGLGYSEFGGRYRFFQNDSWVMSAQATMRVPGTGDTSNPAAIGYTGVETDMRFLVGHSYMLGAMPAFADFQFGERLRTDGPNEFRGDFTLGFQVHPRVQLLVQSFNVISEGAAEPLFPSYEYHKLQLSGLFSITPAFAVQLGGFTTFTGRNALQENGVVAGFGYKF